MQIATQTHSSGIADSSRIRAWLNRRIQIGLGLWEFGHSWDNSRTWRRFLVLSPLALLVLVPWFGFSYQSCVRRSVRIQYLLHQSETLCITKSLEQLQSQMQEGDFARASGLGQAETSTTKRLALSSRKLLELELLSKRVLAYDLRNAHTHYRLGLVYNISGNAMESEAEMLELARMAFGKFPKANAWLVKQRLIAQEQGRIISQRDLVADLKMALEHWEVDPRLHTIYMRLTEPNADLTSCRESAD